MKKLSLVLLGAFFVMYSCGNNKTKENVESNTKSSQSVAIAKMEKGKIVFSNKEKLITQFQNELVKHKKSNVKITDVTIDFSDAVDDATVEIIQVVGSTKDKTVQIAYQLQKEKDEFILLTKNSVLTCEGCRDGCSPRRKANGDGYCTKCTYQGTKACVKTESLPSFTE